MKYAKEENAMKQYRIIYYLAPDDENIEIVIWAKNYEDACIFAKEYRREVFSVQEVQQRDS